MFLEQIFTRITSSLINFFRIYLDADMAVQRGYSGSELLRDYLTPTALTDRNTASSKTLIKVQQSKFFKHLSLIAVSTLSLM